MSPAIHCADDQTCMPGHPAAQRLKLLICGSSQGAYGGIEAVMFALADAARNSGRFEVHIVFKLVKSAKVQTSLEEMIHSCGHACHIAGRMDPNLFSWIDESDLVHVQNVPPDIVGLCKLLGKPLVSTIHNYRRTRFSIHRFLWDMCSKMCDYITFNSAFVMSTWDRGGPTGSTMWCQRCAGYPITILPADNERGSLLFRDGFPTREPTSSSRPINRRIWIPIDGPLP